MSIDSSAELGPALADIGNEAAYLAGGVPDRILLYVEFGEGWVGPSLFRDEGDHIRYVDVSRSVIADLLEDIWYLAPPEKRWTTMIYGIDGGNFDAHFGFDAIEAAEDDSFDRRERVVHARFGRKEIVYPPPPSDAWTLPPA